MRFRLDGIFKHLQTEENINNNCIAAAVSEANGSW